MTVKTGTGLVRGEEEFAIEADRFERLWAMTAGRQVSKTRYFVPLDDGLTAEVDLYDGELAGLVTAEIEFPDEQTALAYEAPEWLGRDVTGDVRYSNRTLATDGIPT
jgi:CYTH domain-containing protein